VGKRFAAVVMAAGKSTRMKSALPKAAHPICGKPMTRCVVDACREAGVETVIIVVGHEAGKVKSALGDDLTYVLQSEQLGTGHACREAMPRVPDDVASVLVLPGDTPLITAKALRSLIDAHTQQRNAATLLTAVLEDASHYGRVVRDPSGAVLRVVEAKDADPGALAIREINTSIYCFARSELADGISRLSNDNAQGEYYLTDVVEMLASSGRRVGAVVAENPADTLGINNRIELAEAAAIMRKRILDRLMLSGVTIVDPATTYIDVGVEIGPDTVIHPCTVIERGSRIGTNCEVGPFARLSGVTIADGTKGAAANGRA
jgi:bifunctional UDP-N-acetylglucosamine pyrophosphorylase/glucosamine-1-phosphate N-acetyltransferase